MDEHIGRLKAYYNKVIAGLKDAFESLTTGFQVVKATNIPKVVPRILVNLVNTVQSTLSASMNFMREVVDSVIFHVQDKVRHFHRALTVIGNAMDERLHHKEAHTERHHVRLRGIEHLLGITTQQATSRATASLDPASTIEYRLSTIEKQLRDMRSDVITLKLALKARELKDTRLLRTGNRDPSPAGRSAASDMALSFACSGESRASSLAEAHLALHGAQQTGHVPQQIAAAQATAYFRTDLHGSNLGANGVVWAP